MNHIYILYITLFMFIITILYLQKKKYKETFTTLNHGKIKEIVNTLYKDTINQYNVKTTGKVYTNGKNNLPNGWTGGLRTVDLYATGTILVGSDNLTKNGVILNRDGSASFADDLVKFIPDGLYIYNKNNRGQYVRFSISNSNGNIYMDTNCGSALAIQPNNNVWFGYPNKWIDQYQYN